MTMGNLVIKYLFISLEKGQAMLLEISVSKMIFIVAVISTVAIGKSNTSTRRRIKLEGSQLNKHNLKALIVF